MNPLDIADEELARLARQASDLATGYWASLDERPAYCNSRGREMLALFGRDWAEQGRGAEVLEDFSAIADHGRASTGRFFGYVFGSGEPVGALGEWLAAALNQNCGAWRSAPAAVTIERSVVGWLAEAIGCAGFSGSLCGGGSTANLMGLAMAREAQAAANEHGVGPLSVYASDQVHMSIPKAVALLGIGHNNLRLIPSDADLRMRVDALRDAIAADRAAGRMPIAIVATAGTVVAGAIDPLEEIAALAKSEGLWLHIDGAYGALAAIALPEALKGLGLADSLSLDAHKWLYQPVDCGCLLYRDAQAARKAFAHSDDYVSTLSQDPVESFAFFEESVELSRRFRALKLWLSLQYHGRAAFRAAIENDLRHAKMLADLVGAQPELELLAPVTLSAVCLRHRTGDNEAILKRVIARGRVFISNATFHGRFALRACFVNHRTTDDDVRLIISEVLAAATEIDA